MKKKPLRTTEQEFNELFLAAIDEALSSLGEGAKTAIYFHLEQKFHIKKQEIPYCLNSFVEALETLFGPGCKPLELMFMQKLHAKVKIKCGPIKPEDFTFPKYVNMVKQNIISSGGNSKKADQAGKHNKNSQPDQDTNFMTLLNFLADPVVIVDAMGRFLWINDAFEAITGLSKEKEIGKFFLEMNILPEESKNILLENLKKRKMGLPVEPYEINFTSVTGEVRFVEVKAKIIEYAGQPADLVIFRDVTRRKSNERRLREYSEKLETLVDAKAREISESAEKLKGIFDSSPDAIIVTNSDLIIVECNQAAIEMGGVSSKAELIGKSGFSFLGEGAVNRVQEVWDLLHKNGVARNIEYTFSAKDGRKITCEFSVSAIKDSSGNVTGFVTITKDITERKKAEERLEKGQDELDCIVDSSPIIIFYKDKEGQFVRVNKTFAETLKMPKEEFLGKTVFDLYSAKIAQGMANDDSEVLKSGCPKLGIMEHYESTSGIRWVQTDKVPIFDKNGIPAGLVGFAQDITEQKKAEEALKESEAKYRELINGMNDTAWVIDLDANFVDVNDAAVKVLGYSREELLSMGPTDIDNSLSREQIRDLVKRMPADQIQVFETAHTTKDGKAIPVEISSSLVTYQGKQAVLSIARNITERKKAEEQLLSSEKKYRELFEDLKRAEAHLLQERDRAQNYLDVASVMLVALDTEGRVTILNRKGCAILGCTAEEALGKNWFDNFLPKNENDKVKRVFQSLTAGKITYPEYHENYVLSKNGEKRLIAWHNTLLKNSKGQITGTLSSGEDITERKKMEDTLKQERDMLESVTENIGAGLVMISKDYRILWMNNYLRQFTGASENNHCYSSFNTCTTICPDCGPEKVFAGAPLDHREYCNQTEFNKDHPVWFELIATPIKDKDGNVVAALELTVNITEKKNMEAKLAKYSQELEKQVEERTRQLQQTQAKLVKSERLAAIGELAGMVGHDLRNPLTSIKGAAYFLKAKYSKGLDATGKMMLATIDNSIEYSNKIINDLLDYSRDIKLELSGTTPKSLLKNTFALIEVPENIKIADETEDTPKFKADTGKMSRVFVNIIKNAFEAMPQGGTFTITSREVKDNVEIVFEDLGIGMSQETLYKLWTPLFTTKAKGMGFGLPICKRIVEAHGGRIFVESAPGIGTTFTVTLPVDPKPTTETEDTWIFNSPVESVIATT